MVLSLTILEPVWYRERIICVQSVTSKFNPVQTLYYYYIILIILRKQLTDNYIISKPLTLLKMLPREIIDFQM